MQDLVAVCHTVRTYVGPKNLWVLRGVPTAWGPALLG